MNLKVLILLGTIERFLIDLSQIFQPLTRLALSTTQVAVNESEA